MPDNINYIREKIGHDLIFLNCAAGLGICVCLIGELKATVTETAVVTHCRDCLASYKAHFRNKLC